LIGFFLALVTLGGACVAPHSEHEWLI
jgi:hypothetical protein